MSKLQDLISTSYGSMDDKFAVNPHDRVRAREAIVEAGEQDISFDKYLEMHSAYLTGKGRDAKHIKEQINKVKDLRSYFE